MFQKLRIKLTILNSAVISSILLILIVALFIEYPEIAYVHGMSHPKKHLDYISVRVDGAGYIVDRTPNLTISDKDLKPLVKMARERNENNGELRLDTSGSYLYLKLVPDNGQGMTIVFVDSKSKAGLVRDFLIESISIAFVSIVLVFFGSLFISGRSLIPIKKAWQKQVDFTADASHELRTPLAVIQTNLELIMGNPVETVESQKKWLENILIENKRMSKLVEDLLTLSRADTSHQTLETGTFMLDKALKEAVLPFEPVAAGKAISLNILFDHRTDFCGDRNRLQQLVTILVDNALKYTNKHGSIDIELRKKDKSVEIVVSDTGEGIGKDHLDKIFDRFYRVDKARARNSGGAGLGLAIAKWIVDEHHGSINVDSTPGKGTRFTVSLPRR